MHPSARLCVVTEAHQTAEWAEVVACTARAAVALQQLQAAIDAYASARR